MRLRRYLAFTLVLSSVGAHATGPKYKKPDVTIPAGWQTPAPWHQAGPVDSIPKGAWWTLFGDAELNQYEDRALANNQTEKAALARLSEARSSARITSSGLYPELDAAPSAGRQLAPGNRPLYIQSITKPASVTANAFSIPFTLNYEVDLFGRVRRNVEAATAASTRLTWRQVPVLRTGNFDMSNPCIHAGPPCAIQHAAATWLKAW